MEAAASSSTPVASPPSNGQLARSPHRVTVGAESPGSRDALYDLGHRLIDEGRDLCVDGKYSEAATAFAHALAVCEQDVLSASTRASVQHNLAYCHHSLGEWDAARMHYESALATFRTIRTSTLERWTIGWMYGDVNESRIQFIKERLVDIEFQRMPEHEYLDEWGRKHPVESLRSAAQQSSAGLGDAVYGLDDESTPWMDQGLLAAHAGTLGGGYDFRAGYLGPRGGTGDMGDVPAAGSRGSGTRGSGDGRPPAVDTGPVADERPPAELEQARQEWLAYHMTRGDVEAAATLVVTAEEREALDQRRREVKNKEML